MLCPQCGRDVFSGSQYCSYCGAALRPSSSPPPAMQFDLSTPPQSSNSLTFDLSTPAPAAATSASSASKPSARKGGLVGLLAALGAILLKFKAVILAVLLKLKYVFALLKFGKILTTMSTMLLSIGVYATLWGWKLATGLMLLTLVHEMGHVLVAWRKKLPVSAPMFIPGLGALILLKQRPQDALTEAQIGYGGPALGAVGDTVAWGCYYLTGHPLFLAAAHVSMMWNLFNLMPVSPLDGGRITAAISPRIWLIGLVVMGVWFLLNPNVILLLVLIFGGLRIAAQWKTMNTSEYFKVAPQARLTMTLLYIGLALYLGWGYAATHNILTDWIQTHTIMR